MWILKSRPEKRIRDTEVLLLDFVIYLLTTIGYMDLLCFTIPFVDTVMLGLGRATRFLKCIPCIVLSTTYKPKLNIMWKIWLDKKSYNERNQPVTQEPTSLVSSAFSSSRSPIR